MRILAILFTTPRRYAHKAQKGHFLGCKGVGSRDARWWFCKRTRWDHGGSLPLLLGLWYTLGLVPNYVVLVLGNEDGGPHHLQGCHTRGLWIGSRKLVILTLKIYQIFNWDYFSFFLSQYLCLAQRLILIYIYNINHIAICMCNSLSTLFFSETGRLSIL